MNITTQAVTFNISPPDQCFRLIHDGARILNYFEASGFTRTLSNLFCGTDEECQAEMARLGFTPVTAPYQQLPTDRYMSKAAFWAQFTADEQAAIVTSDDPGVRAFLQGLAFTDHVDLASDMVATGLTNATAASVLAPGRSSNILVPGSAISGGSVTPGRSVSP